MPADAPALAAGLPSEELAVARPPAIPSPHSPQKPVRDEQPSAEAELHLALLPERCNLEFKTPSWLGGMSLKLDSRTFGGSSLAMAITVVLLTASGCLIAGTAAAIGAPMWVIVGGLLIPAGVFAVVRVLHRAR
jgi:hypothetical protein